MAILSHRFVDFIPEKVDEGVLYVSLTYGTVIHRCCCGCGREVVTPLSPADWKLIFDGETISLTPSIGNWNFPCRSHYWIRNNRAEWVEDWPGSTVGSGIPIDSTIEKKHPKTQKTRHKTESPQKAFLKKNSFWHKITSWIAGK